MADDFDREDGLDRYDVHASVQAQIEPKVAVLDVVAKGIVAADPPNSE